MNSVTPMIQSPGMMPMQHRMSAPYGGGMPSPFSAPAGAPYGMPPPNFQPYGGYGPQAGWG